MATKSRARKPRAARPKVERAAPGEVEIIKRGDAASVETASPEEDADSDSGADLDADSGADEGRDRDDSHDGDGDDGDSAMELGAEVAEASRDDLESSLGEGAEPLHTYAGKAGGREIAKFDPLGVYMREVSRYRLLTREEEHKLAVNYLETGDIAAARALVTANLRLVVKIAHEYRRAHQNLLDMVQEGNVGLMQAVKKYNPFQGVKFSSYAAWWIRAYILKYVMSNFRLVKLGTTQAQRKLFFNLRKEKEKLEAAGYDASPKQLAAALDVREDEVREMDERMGQRDLSLDAPLNAADGPGEGTRHIDLLRSLSRGADDDLADAELSAVVSERLRTFAAALPEKERYIYEHRLVAESPATLQELGDHFSISRERARQLEKRIVDRARAFLRQEMGRDFDLVAEE